MNDTRFRKALVKLCEQRPELRKKLAAELSRQRKPIRKKADEEANYMVVQSLMKLTDRSPEILEMIHSEADNLDDWQEHFINLAAEYIDAVYDSLRYRLENEEEWP